MHLTADQTLKNRHRETLEEIFGTILQKKIEYRSVASPKSWCIIVSLFFQTYEGKAPDTTRLIVLNAFGIDTTVQSNID